MDRVEGQLSDEQKEVLADLRAAWPAMSPDERVDGLRLLPEDEAEEFFLALTSREQSQLVREMPQLMRRTWVRLLPLDDAADVIQEAPPEEREALLRLLDEISAREVRALLAYAEDEAGGLMNPRFARLRPEMTVDEAITYLRRQAQQHDRPIYYTYVLDAEQRLRGVLSFRQLLTSGARKRIEEVMRTDVVTVPEDLDQEEIAKLLRQNDVVALPVIDAAGRMKGVVSAEDIVDVMQEEATEDIQKLGGVQALEAPFLDTGVAGMIKKRVVWLLVLFGGGLLTIHAMQRYEAQIEKVAILAFFVPLIIASGGNTGAQSSTLVIRAMALGELRIADWWRVFRRELLVAGTLGALIGAIGLAYVWGGQRLGWIEYAGDALRFATAVGGSLVGVMLFGALLGVSLPFLLRLCRLDPATACTPFVATLTDVTGLMIYFTVAVSVLGGL